MSLSVRNAYSVPRMKKELNKKIKLWRKEERERERERERKKLVNNNQKRATQQAERERESLKPEGWWPFTCPEAEGLCPDPGVCALGCCCCCVVCVCREKR